MTTPPFATNDLNALRAVLSKRHPVCAVVWSGQPAYGKLRTGPRPHERLFLSLAPVFRRWLGREFDFEPADYSPSVPVEVQRLRRLRSMGWLRVPEVLAATNDVFVTASAGRTLESQLNEEQDVDARLVWLLEAARDLAAFHRAGHWHGAAQLRNIVRMPDGRLGRIDFETSLDTRLPLPLLQAFDAILFFSSLARTRDANVLPAVARAYLFEAPEATRIVLQRGHPLISRLARSRMVLRLAPKEAERLRAVADLPLS